MSVAAHRTALLGAVSLRVAWPGAAPHRDLLLTDRHTRRRSASLRDATRRKAPLRSAP